MNRTTVDALGRQIEQLSTDEREELLNRILLMPADDQAEIDASWKAEIERRVAAMDRGEMSFHRWEEVRKDLGLKRHRSSSATKRAEFRAPQCRRAAARSARPLVRLRPP